MAERSERYFPEILDERSSYLNLSPLTAIIQELRRKNVVTAAAATAPQMSLLDSSDPWGSSEAFGVDDTPPQLGIASYGSCSCGTGAATGAATTQKSSARRRMSWTGLRYGSRTSSLGYMNSPLSGPSSVPTNSKDKDKGSPGHPLDGSSNGANNSAHNNNNNNNNSKDHVCPACGNIKVDAVTASRGDAWARNPRRSGLSSWLVETRTERLEAPQHAEALLQSTPHLRIISPASTDMQGAGTTTPRNILLNLILPSSTQNKHHHHPAPLSSSSTDHHPSSSSNTSSLDYGASLVRDRANQQAATELSSLLWILAHEMSLEDYGAVESEIFTSVFALVHEAENERRMAGLAALDALIDAPSADEEKKAIKFANTLSNGLRSAHGDYEFLSAVSKALGHMATRTANVDFVESEVTRALEWLRTERSDRRCVIIGLYCCLFHFLLLYCICLCLCRKQAFSLTHNPPCLFYGYI
jgi:hypothetical protein